MAGRLQVENLGIIEIGDHLNVNSTWVPVELHAGPLGRIDVGHDVLINFGTVIAAAKSVSIGSGTMIGPHCIISDVEIPEAAVSLAPTLAKPIAIGQGAWLAGRVTVRPGVKIGDGAVVVAGSIVETDVPAGAMASGIPARPLPKFDATAAELARTRAALNPGRSVSVATQAAVCAEAAPSAGPRGNLIADFVIEELVHELAQSDANPAVTATALPAYLPGQSLVPTTPSAAKDFAVIWTRPEVVAPSFTRLLAGESVPEKSLLAEVDAFCALVEQSAVFHRFVFVPTWSAPPHVRGAGLLDTGPGGIAAGLAAMNARLIATVGRRNNVFVLNAQRWQATVGARSYNPRAWYLGNMAMARPFVAEAARDLRAALATLLGRQRKLLVLAIDDVLWDVPDPAAGTDVAIMRAYADFQQALRELRRRGALLGILTTATRAGSLPSAGAHEGVRLHDTDFVGCCEEDGDPGRALATWLARLGLEADSAVYVDSRETHRTRVRAALPALHVPDWPGDKFLYPSALQALPCFDRAPLTHDRLAAAQ